MPLPRYIICCETQIQDRRTSLVTHCNVIDGFAFIRHDGDSPSHDFKDGNPFAKMTASASWMAEASDDKQTEYDYEYLIHKPDAEPAIVAGGKFKFSRRFHLLEMGILFGAKSRLVAGMHFIENRIRACGTNEWLSQKFPFTIEDITTSPAVSGKETADENANHS